MCFILGNPHYNLAQHEWHELHELHELSFPESHSFVDSRRAGNNVHLLEALKLHALMSK